MAKNSQQDIDLLAQVVRSNPDFKLTKAVRDKLKAEVLKIEFAQASAASRNSKQLVTRQLDLPSTHDSDKVDRILREVEALKNSRHLGMYGTLSAIVNWDIGINHGNLEAIRKTMSIKSTFQALFFRHGSE